MHEKSRWKNCVGYRWTDRFWQIFTQMEQNFECKQDARNTSSEKRFETDRQLFPVDKLLFLTNVFIHVCQTKTLSTAT